VRYSRSYVTSLGAVSLDSSTNSSDYAVYGRAGWIGRLSPRDEVAGSIELWQLWQRVAGYSDPIVAFNPLSASIATGTDRTSLVKLADNGHICSARASRATSTAPSSSRLRRIPASSPP
jgi:hypothetical protein